ncbi:MAG: hypothetical protein JNM22_05540 [Saprospiraceae bacterium]|nr:hypothetical protein [Saprospiraceae bacterium]
MLTILQRFLRRRTPQPPAPPIFDTCDAFLAALRGHSEARSCFAQTNALPQLRTNQVDVIIYAAAYASDDCSGPVLFSCSHQVLHNAQWPLHAYLRQELEKTTNEINTFFHH